MILTTRDYWRERQRARWPNVVVLKSDPYIDPDDGPGMDFHLTYEGKLLGSSSANPRAKHKHELRRVFHRQLRRYWDVHPYLREATFGLSPSNTALHRKPMRDALASLFQRGKYKFVPLVTTRLILTCSISILFLRPDIPGNVLQSADIDNRLKTLFDALRLPGNTSEFGGYDVPAEGEDPFYCLLENDNLISHVSVEADTLLEPIGDEFDKNDARLIIMVKIRPYNITLGNINFG